MRFGVLFNTDVAAKSRLAMINLDEITEDGGVVPERTQGDDYGLGATNEAFQQPHHQTANFAAILPDYSNLEQDYIRQAFSKTSFVSVRDLPTRFKPTATARAFAAKIDANRRKDSTSRRIC